MRVQPLLEGEKLSLTNEGQLEIFFLGVGGAFTEIHNQTNFLIIKGQNHLLVDFGVSGPAALRSLTGLRPIDIKAILPTHCHGDHVGGVEMMALMARYISRERPDLFAEPILAKELWEHTLRGGCEKNECHHPGGYLTLVDYFNVISPTPLQGFPRPTYQAKVFQNFNAKNPIKVELFRTRHVPKESVGWWDAMVSYGILIDDRIFFSGDALFDRDNILSYASRCEWMFQDTCLLINRSHATLDELKTLPKEVKQKMFNIHYGDNFHEFDNSEFAGWTQQGVRYIFD